MNDEQEKRVVNALVEFVERVANGKATSDTEVEAMPKVAEVLLDYESRMNHR